MRIALHIGRALILLVLNEDFGRVEFLLIQAVSVSNSNDLLVLHEALAARIFQVFVVGSLFIWRQKRFVTRDFRKSDLLHVGLRAVEGVLGVEHVHLFGRRHAGVVQVCFQRVQRSVHDWTRDEGHIQLRLLHASRSIALSFVRKLPEQTDENLALGGALDFQRVLDAVHDVSADKAEVGAAAEHRMVLLLRARLEAIAKLLAPAEQKQVFEQVVTLQLKLELVRAAI